MDYVVDPNAEIPIMLIDKHIGFDSAMEAECPGTGEGIMGDKFQQSLLTLDTMGKKSIEVRICTEGGGVMDAMKIYHSILASKTPVDTLNNGIAASSGAIIYMAGRKKKALDYAQFMFHNPSGGADDALDPIRDSIITMVSKRCGKTPEEVGAMMNRTTWIDADEAKGIFCDEDGVIDSGSLNTVKNILLKNRLTLVRDIINNALPKSEKMNKETLALLGLKEGATPAEIENAIKNVSNKLTTTEGELKKVKNEMEEGEESEEDKAKAKAKAEAKKKEDMKDEYAKMKATMDEMEAKMKEVENVTNASVLATKTTAAATMVAKYTNRIGNKAETVKMWVDQAINNFESTEKMLSELPLHSGLDLNKTKNTVDYGKDEVPIDPENPNAYFVKMNAKKYVETQNRLKR